MAKLKKKAAKQEDPPKLQKAPILDDSELLAISRAVADPNRFALLRKISHGDAGSCCGELLAGLDIKAATLSHHLKELETAGLIETAREGKFVRATIKRRTWKSYVSSLKDMLPAK